MIAEVNPSLPLRIFRLRSTKDEYGAYDRSIDVLVGEDSAVKQTLECDMADGGSIFAADLNFDGYYDLLALSFKGSGHNYGYCNWLFDKKTGTYKPSRNEGLGKDGFGNEDIELVAPYLDYLHKTVRTTWSGSDRSSTNYYKYSKGTLAIQTNVTVDYLVNRSDQSLTYRRTVKRMVDGKMVIESRKVVSDPKDAFFDIWQ